LVYSIAYIFLSEPISSPPKPTIIKHVPERKPTRPVKLKLAHRQQDTVQDEEPEDETMATDNYHQVPHYHLIVLLPDD
jgi:hypothetical protein